MSLYPLVKNQWQTDSLKMRFFFAGFYCIQKEIAEALEGIDGCFNISDNVMVFGCSQKEHDKYLEVVLQRCQERDLRLGLDKYQLNLY